MQFINKKDIEFKRGYFVVDDKIMMPTPELVSQVNKLAYLNDVMKFIAENLDEIKAATEKKEVPTFTPQAVVSIKQTPNTPNLDEYVDKISSIMDEIEATAIFAKADKIVTEYFDALLEFAHEEDVLLSESFNHSFKMVMNPLNFDDEKIIDFINTVLEAKDYIALVVPHADEKFPELFV